jgi:hypothetical protein
MICNQAVAGSSPAAGTIRFNHFIYISHSQHKLFQSEVSGWGMLTTLIANATLLLTQARGLVALKGGNGNGALQVDPRQQRR